MTATERTALHSVDGTALVADVAWVGTGRPGVVVVHGLDSTRVNHRDMVERLVGAGINAAAVDLRGHGESAGELDAGAVEDVLAALDLLAERGAGPLGLRGSSLGGFLALHAAARHQAVRAVVALCPAHHVGLADRHPRLEWARAMDLTVAVAGADGVARGFWHARDDEVIPWQWSWVLHQAASHPKHLRIVMGGSHRSLQHDPVVQADNTTFLAEHLGGTRALAPDG